MDNKKLLESVVSDPINNIETMNGNSHTLMEVWIHSLLFSFYYIFAEWIFLITKPTFDVRVNFGEKVLFLVFTLVLWTFILSIVFLIIFLISKGIRGRQEINFIYSLSCLFPTGIMAAFLLMIIDNFTYTVFQFGILTVSTIFRIVYLIILIIIGFLIYHFVRKTVRRKAKNRNNIITRWRFEKVILVFIIFDILIIGSQYKTFETTSSRAKLPILSSRPNIILVTADGLNADHMSVYGYSRKTTPNIDDIAKNSLIAMNNFSNASDSQGSVISILTGKNPAETRVLYSPDVLMGNDTYEHMPGILHDAGYSTYQLGDPFFVDANASNMMGGFDYVNNTKSYGSFWYFLNRYFPPQHQIFIRNIFERITIRLQKLFWLEKFQNPGDILAGKPQYMYDIEKIETIKKILKSNSKPVFIHLHMLGTHGPTFLINSPVFSIGHPSNGNWDIDYYDDSILQFDSFIGELFQFLEENDLSNTLLIIGSDHGQVWKSNVRIPLIVHFPHNPSKNMVYSNTQNIDIYPTMLDYIGLANIYKGNGFSLLEDVPEIRPIISLGVNTISVTEQGRISFRPNSMKPPFFQFGYINLVYCDKWFKINLDETTFVSGRVENSINSCPLGQKIDDGKAIEIMLEFLKGNGFNTSILSEQLIID